MNCHPPSCRAGAELASQSGNVASAEQSRLSIAQGSPIKPETVTHVPERLLPISPVRTVGLSSGVDRLLQAVRVHDLLEPFTPSGFVNGLRFARETWDTVRAEHRRRPWLKQVDYDFRRDNRHEQPALLY